MKPRMLMIDVEPNPNCEAITMVFREIEPPRRIMKLKVYDDRGERWCRVTGLDSDGRSSPAYAQKVEDSGEGVAYLIYGGAWGLRFKPDDSRESWDLEDPDAWGEAYKVYGDPDDILFE